MRIRRLSTESLTIYKWFMSGKKKVSFHFAIVNLFKHFFLNRPNQLFVDTA